MGWSGRVGRIIRPAGRDGQRRYCIESLIDGFSQRPPALPWRNARAYRGANALRCSAHRRCQSPVIIEKRSSAGSAGGEDYRDRTARRPSCPQLSGGSPDLRTRGGNSRATSERHCRWPSGSGPRQSTEPGIRGIKRTTPGEAATNTGASLGLDAYRAGAAGGGNRPHDCSERDRGHRRRYVGQADLGLRQIRPTGWGPTAPDLLRRQPWLGARCGHWRPAWRARPPGCRTGW